MMQASGPVTSRLCDACRCANIYFMFWVSCDIPALSSFHEPALSQRAKAFRPRFRQLDFRGVRDAIGIAIDGPPPDRQALKFTVLSWF